MEVIPRLARCSVFKDRSVPAAEGLSEQARSASRATTQYIGEIVLDPVDEQFPLPRGTRQCSAGVKSPRLTWAPSAAPNGHRGGRPGPSVAQVTAICVRKADVDCVDPAIPPCRQACPLDPGIPPCRQAPPSLPSLSTSSWRPRRAP